MLDDIVCVRNSPIVPADLDAVHVVTADRHEAYCSEVRCEAEPVVPGAVELDGVPRRDEQLRVAAAQQEGTVRYPGRAHGQRVPHVDRAGRIGVHR
jgi:hypothetical protein